MLEAAAFLEAAGRSGVDFYTGVPCSFLTPLINRVASDPALRYVGAASEGEAVAIAAGAWLGGRRGVLLMQSSGVGNCINMLSLPAIARVPMLMLVTMRGEWAEFNPWQVPMSMATKPSLNAIGVRTLRADTEADVLEVVPAAASAAYEADGQVAVLLGQRLLGKKTW